MSRDLSLQYTLNVWRTQSPGSWAGCRRPALEIYFSLLSLTDAILLMPELVKRSSCTWMTHLELQPGLMGQVAIRILSGAHPMDGLRDTVHVRGHDFGAPLLSTVDNLWLYVPISGDMPQSQCTNSEVTLRITVCLYPDGRL